MQTFHLHLHFEWSGEQEPEQEQNRNRNPDQEPRQGHWQHQQHSINFPYFCHPQKRNFCSPTSGIVANLNAYLRTQQRQNLPDYAEHHKTCIDSLNWQMK